MKKNKIFLISLFFLILIGFLYFDVFSLFHIDEKKADSGGYLSLFLKITDLVRTEYVETVDPAEKFSGAFSSMVSTVDIYSSYLNEKQTRQFDMFQKGHFYSCGLFGIKENMYFSVRDVLSDSPAEKAGIEVGDIIRKVNGISFYGLSFWQMFLSLMSDGPESFTIIRSRKNTNSLISRVLDPVRVAGGVAVKSINRDIGYLSLMRFDRSSVEKVKSEMIRNRKMKWIVDLRKYSGGDLTSFREIAGILVPEVIPLSLETQKERMDFLIGSEAAVGKRCVFIINESTILFSELLAHVLKRSNSILVGKETTGFVPSLDQFFLQDGSSVILNTGVYKLKNEPLIGVGVQPSVEVESLDHDFLTTRCVEILGDLR